MTQQELAEEIFAHAVAYYDGPLLAGIPGIGDDIMNYLVSHANPIDVADGGDSFIRKVAFSAIWTFTGDSI